MKRNEVFKSQKGGAIQINIFMKMIVEQNETRRYSKRAV